ncbi:hypothetical protein [Flavobacterium sp. 14A]|uniref:hypothetical protein n=1 Tax=Flavobacterium sp. 14A TaxID=2735896 RepID=UPI00156FD537|nr:hypothetical protein [Flavobacterium sp. 14A]NRT10544.1 hypothetical protein [Flavobacterium sp. 14A]
MENNNKLTVASQSSLLNKVNSSVDITNKLITENNKKLVAEIFESNPKFFTDLISEYYSLNEQVIDLCTDIWNWNSISNNLNINWTISFITKYQNSLIFEEYGMYSSYIDSGLITNTSLKWDFDLLITFKTKWNLAYFSAYIDLSWTDDKIDFLENILDWDGHVYGSVINNQHIKWDFKLIEKYKNKICWRELSYNERLPWSEQFIDKYAEKWFWGDEYYNNMSHNKGFPWSIGFIKKYTDKWQWTGIHSLSDNPYIPFSIELIEEFKEKWAWDGEYGLSNNIGINFTTEIIDRFIDRWDWKFLSNNEKVNFTQETIDRYANYIDWDSLSKNRNILWTIDLIEQYESQINWKDFNYSTFESSWILIEEYSSRLDFNQLSSNKSNFWNEVVIEQYKDKLNWKRLSNIETLPWNENFIKDYEDLWNWNDGHFDLSSNKNLPWSYNFINRYADRWNWENLSKNESINWNVKLLHKHSHKLIYPRYKSPTAIWNTLKPYIDDELIIKLLENIQNNK